MAGTIVCNTLNTDTGLFSTNNAYLGMAKAWVNFTNSSGTITVNNTFNISSVTRTSTGVFTISFTTAMPSSNYSVVGNSSSGLSNAGVLFSYNFTTSSFTALTSNISALYSPLSDNLYNSIAVLSN